MKEPFFPHPAEFNLGYKSSEEAQAQKKSRKWVLPHRLKVLMFSTLLVLPLTVNIGLWDIRSFEFGPGTYSCGSSFVHFGEDSGWFFNGEYFIPMTWNQTSNTYEAVGAYPADGGYGGHYAEYVQARAGGDIEVSEEGVILLDPFTQQKLLYTPSDASFNTAAIDAYNSQGAQLSGHWKGRVIPAPGYPTAFPISIDISGSTAVLNVTSTEDGHVQSYSGSCSIADCVISFTMGEPLEYILTTADGEISFSYDKEMPGILFFTTSGSYLALNVFTSQLFGR